MALKSSSWKQKVYPALIDKIRAFVKLIENLEIPEYKEPQKTFLEIVKDSKIKSFKPFYEKNTNKNQLIDLANFISTQDVSDLNKNIKKHKKLKAELEKRFTPETVIHVTFQTF